VPKLIGIRGAIRVERNDADLITNEWRVSWLQIRANKCAQIRREAPNRF